MDEPTIAEIEAALKAATPGPWFWNSYAGVWSGFTPDDAHYDDWSAATLPELCEMERRSTCDECRAAHSGCPHWNAIYERDPFVASVPAHHGDTATGRHAADAHLIANAPTYLAFLLARASELESALRATIEAHGFCDDGGCTFAIASALLPAPTQSGSTQPEKETR